MSVASNQSGRFVVLVGPDGVGKTSVARALLAQHNGPAGYFHFLPPLTGPLMHSVEAGPPPPPKASERGWQAVGWLRLLRNAARCWTAYVATVRPAVRPGALVVGDRWLYGYVVQPHALRFYGPDWFARAIVRLLPRPDLVVNLSAPAPIVRQRKQELTLEQIERELAAWSALPIKTLRTFDATLPPHEVATAILAALGTSAGDRRADAHDVPARQFE
jgi:thymidylate kinase